MRTIQDNAIIIDKETTKLQAFRLEDTARAPMVILYVDDNQAELVPLKPGQTPPTLIKSANMEAEVQIISYAEVHSFMHQDHENH